MPDREFDYDVIVIGSGFGGSVSALRLTEKGYKVAVLEAGKRYEDKDFAKSSWRLRKFLWMPQLGCYGIQRIDKLKDVLILSGAGVGGGSLVYANTLYEPLDPFYKDPAWGHITDWKAELAPYYDQAKRMLGVEVYPIETAADTIIKQVAEDMGVGGTFHHTPVGLFFGEPGKTVADPYFGGAGPDRAGCLHCGECMTGCRHNAKNTLVKNYLYLAEKGGAEVHPLTTVTSVTPLAGGGYEIETRRTNRRFRPHRKITAEQVIFSASTMGTQKLLHKMRDRGALPERVRPARAADAYQLRGPARCDRRRPRGRLQPRRRDHVVVPPRRAHPRRAGALRQGLQRDVADADRADRRQHRHAALAGVAQGDVAAEAQHLQAVRPAALVGAHGHRAGHADPRQLDHDLHQARHHRAAAS